jgi:DNA-directed RNA polymerase specialized sigma24 family protein
MSNKEEDKEFKDFNLNYTSEEKLLEFAHSICALELCEMETIDIKLNSKDWQLLLKKCKLFPLSVMQREVVHDHYWKGMTLEKIAAYKKIAIGTVASHLARAKQKKRKSITFQSGM